MEVEVKLYTTLREIAGTKRENFSLPSMTMVRDLLDFLVERYGDDFSKHIFNKQKQVRSEYSYLLNGINIKKLEGFNTMLEEGDIISILPPSIDPSVVA